MGLVLDTLYKSQLGNVMKSYFLLIAVFATALPAFGQEMDFTFDAKRLRATARLQMSLHLSRISGEWISAPKR